MPSRITLGASLAVILALVACGDSSGSSTTGATDTAALETSLTVRYEAVTGVNGLVLVASLANPGEAPVASACSFADADPWSGSSLFASASPDNPCGFDAPFGQPMSEPRTYSYSVGVFVPGEQVPTRCATGEVAVSGATEIVITDADLSTDCG